MEQENFPNEQWKEYHDEDWVESYRYLVSNYGRIKSLKVSKHYKNTIKGSITHGYAVISGKNIEGKTRNRYVHIVVAKLFIPNPEGKEFVIHFDHNKPNNRAYNLRWANKDEKNAHIRTRQQKGGIPNNSKLTETEVIRLKRILHNPNRKTRYKILARQFGVTEMQLHRIKSGENWGHVKY